MPFSTDDLEALRNDLKSLPVNRAKDIGKRDAITALAGELAAAQRRGYNVEDLAKLLESKGLAASAMSLKAYLRMARKKRQPAAAKAAAARTVAKPAAAAPAPTVGADGGKLIAARTTANAAPTAARAPSARPDPNGAGQGGAAR
jgi:hypothetical protein